jgi:hypothetical protein
MSTLRLSSINAEACLSTNSRSRIQPRDSGLTLSGDFSPVLKGGVWRRRTGQFYCLRGKEGRGEMVGLFFFNEFFFF